MRVGSALAPLKITSPFESRQPPVVTTIRRGRRRLNRRVASATSARRRILNNFFDRDFKRWQLSVRFIWQTETATRAREPDTSGSLSEGTLPRIFFFLFLFPTRHNERDCLIRVPERSRCKPADLSKRRLRRLLSAPRTLRIFLGRSRILVLAIAKAREYHRLSHRSSMTWASTCTTAVIKRTERRCRLTGVRRRSIIATNFTISRGAGRIRIHDRWLSNRRAALFGPKGSSRLRYLRLPRASL